MSRVEASSTAKLNSLERRIAQQKKRAVFSGCVWVFDPGQTTGFCKYYTTADGTPFLSVDQWNYLTIAGYAFRLNSLIDMSRNDYWPSLILLEDYRVYAWKAQHHTWNPLYTPRLIGAIEALAGVNRIPIIKQSAQNAKGFAKDEVLKSLGLYQATVGLRHARDAMRHLVFFLLANEKNHNPSFDEQQTALTYDPEEIT
jgi:hypothetical protein